MRSISVSSPGKVILAGEHAVVHGQLGIWVAVDKRLSITVQSVDKGLKIASSHDSTELAHYAIMKIGEIFGENIDCLEINIDSTIPVGSGMGSSAALAVALTGALTKYYKKPWNIDFINETALTIERKQHGTPSGGDNKVVTLGGFLKFRRQQDGTAEFEKITNYRKIENLIVIDSGKPKETTKEMVEKVTELYKSDQARFSSIFSRIGDISQSFCDYIIKKNEVNVGELIGENHRLLCELEVVSPKAQDIIKKIEQVGGHAKISGAGGFKEGSGVLLAFHKEPEKLQYLAELEKWKIIPVTLGAEGVRED